MGRGDLFESSASYRELPIEINFFQKNNIKIE